MSLMLEDSGHSCCIFMCVLIKTVPLSLNRSINILVHNIVASNVSMVANEGQCSRDFYRKINYILYTVHVYKSLKFFIYDNIRIKQNK